VAQTPSGEPADRIRRLDRSHVIHSWSVQAQLDPLPVAGARGAYFWDHDGRRYLDFASQAVNVNLGHQHPRLVEAIQRQAGTLCTAGAAMAEEQRSELGRLLAEVTPGDLRMAFFTNGGADANESAVKLARWITGRQKVIARYRSYHGATAGAASLTGDPRRWPVEPAVPGVVRMLDPYVYRCPAGHGVSGDAGTAPLSTAELERHAARGPVCAGGPHLEEILQYEDPLSVAAVILEPVTGANGVLVPPPCYLRSIRDACDRHGILLILDEVMTGFGRTGAWFACEHWDVVPDIMTVAKGITSGYLPLGAMIVGERGAEWLRTNRFATGLTSTGNPLGCAAAVATIETLRDERLVEHTAAMGETVGSRLAGMAVAHPSVGDVRGLGLLWAIELVRDRASREPLVPFNASGEAALPMRRLTAAAMERGLSLMTHWNVVLVAPPLTIADGELAEGLAILDDVLTLADEYCTTA
jgi:taurine--2-oxoglutarate transaminase